MNDDKPQEAKRHWDKLRMGDKNHYETKEYPDGTVATGIAPLPEESPTEGPEVSFKVRLLKNIATFNADATDPFTKAVMLMFTFQDAYDEKCAALERCQRIVHQEKEHYSALAHQFQEELCGRTHMGEPVIEYTDPAVTIKGLQEENARMLSENTRYKNRIHDLEHTVALLWRPQNDT